MLLDGAAELSTRSTRSAGPGWAHASRRGRLLRYRGTMHRSILDEPAPFPSVTTTHGLLTLIPRWGDVLDFLRQGRFSQAWPTAEHGWHRPDAAGCLAVVLMVAELGRYASHAIVRRRFPVVPFGSSTPGDDWG